MPVMLNLDVADEWSDAVEGTVEKLQHPAPFFARWGQRAAIKTRANARAKGGRRLWGEIARATHLASYSDHHAQVAIDHVAARIRQTGGTIRPRDAKALTIPLTDEAEGKRAGEFELGGQELFILEPQAGDPATVGILGYNDPDDDSFHGLYLLRSRVTHPADPYLPTPLELGQMAIEEGVRLLEAQL